MIVLKLHVDNIYMFNDFDLDLVVPREVSNNIIGSERLIDAPEIIYKKANMIMGGNACGKTTLGKILCDIQNFLMGRQGEFFYKKYDKSKKSELEILFTLKGYLFKYYLSFNDKNMREIIYRTKLRKSYNLKKHLELLEDDLCYETDTNIDIENRNIPIVSVVIHNNMIEKQNIKFMDFFMLNSYYFTFASFTEDSVIERVENLDLKKLEKLIKIIDDSIDSVRAIKSETTEGNDLKRENSYYIVFKNGDRILVEGGNLRNIKDSRLSQGTVEAVEISYILNNIDQYSGIVYLDEQMAYMHTELSNALILKIITSMPKEAQLFITTHNENVLNLNIPIHSFTFLAKKNNNIISINPEKYLNKNDRKLINYVQNNYFESYPDLDGLWIDED